MTTKAKKEILSPSRSDRNGKRLLACHADLEVYRAFKILAAKTGGTTDIMLSQALLLLFKHHEAEVPVSLKQKLAKLGLL